MLNRRDKRYPTPLTETNTEKGNLEEIQEKIANKDV